MNNVTDSKNHSSDYENLPFDAAYKRLTEEDEEESSEDDEEQDDE